MAKSGANPQDIVRIGKMLKGDPGNDVKPKSVAAIAKALGIKESVVKSFADDLKKQAEAAKADKK